MAIKRLFGRNVVMQDDGDGIMREGTVPVYATAATIKAIPAADRFDGFQIQQADTGDFYIFDAEATAANLSAAQEPMKYIPDAGTGQWFRLGTNSHVLLDPTPMKVLNDSGVDVAQYEETYLSGYDPTTGLLTVAKARSNALGTGATGVRTALCAIPNGKIGYTGKSLALINQDTSTATSSGKAVYLSDAVSGARVFDGSAPVGANSRYPVGRVAVKHAVSGVIFIDHENRFEEHNHADAARGDQITAAGIAALGITADATGRGIFANGLFDSATVDLKFAAGCFAATAAARALFVTDFIDAATWLDKVAADAIVATSFSGAGKKFAAGSLVEAGITSLFGASAFTAAHFSGASIKFAASALDAAGWLSLVALDAITTTSFSGVAKKFAAGALDVAGTLSIFAANAMTEANVDAIFAAGAINGSKAKAATIAGAKLTNDARVRFITINIPGATFNNIGPRRYNCIPGIAGTVQAMSICYDTAPGNGGNVVLDLNKNLASSMFSVAPDVSMNVNPGYVAKTTDGGATYTDYTAAATDSNAATDVVLSGLDTFAAGDWLLVGHATLKFGRVYFDVDAANPNANASVMTAEYSDGAGAWLAVGAPFLDGTQNPPGTTLGQDGVFSFIPPANWLPQIVPNTDGVSRLYVRFLVSAALDAATLVDEMRVGDATSRYKRFLCDQNNAIVATDTVDLVVDDADATAAGCEVILEVLPT